MADLNMTVLTNLLRQNYGAEIVKAFSQEGPSWFVPEQSIMGRLRAAGRTFNGGGDGNNRYAREWGIHSATGTATSYDENDTYPAAQTETYGDASIDWRNVWITSEIVNRDRIAAGASASRDQMAAWSRDQFAKLESLFKAIETQLASDGTGNGGKDITGFLAFLSASNNYAGIDQSANSYWRAVVSNAASAAISKELLQSLVRSLYDNEGIGPFTEMWMPLVQFQRYRQLFDDKIRYAPGDQLGQVGAPMYDDGGFQIPIRIIKAVPTSEVWVINLDTVELRSLPQTPEDNIEQRDQTMDHESLPIGIEAVNTDRDTKAIAYKYYGNAVCTNPRKNGRLYGLSTS